MRLARITELVTLVAAGVLVLAACSDNTTSSTVNVTPTGVACAGGTLRAEGSSAQSNAVWEWTKAYQLACPEATVNYNPTGSGAGIGQFLAAQVDFAGSDSALDAEDGEVEEAKQRCNGNDAWNLPMVVGPVALAFNVDGAPDLVLDAETAAKIFSGQITRWNDSAIAALNPGASLPDDDITVFFRSDDSGTTQNFSRYLSAAAPNVWTQKPAKTWRGVGEGKAQSAGVQQGVKNNKNSISYMEWSSAKDGGLGVAKINNGSGSPVELTSESAGKALESASVPGSGNDLSLKIDYTTNAPETYPIVLVTYEIVCSAGQEKATTDLIKSFLGFTADQGQDLLVPIGYASLPDSVKSKVQTAVSDIR